MKHLFFSILLLSSINVFSQCFEITNILVDACGNPEGANEMVRIEIGPSDLNVANLDVNWATSGFVWQGACQNAGTASRVAAINASILGCGLVLEPTGGVLPANSKVIIVTNDTMDVSANSFAFLNDTIYLVFQCAWSTVGHFGNYNASPGLRDLSIGFSGLGGCWDTVTYERSLLTNIFGTSGGSTADKNGASVLFAADGTATYYNNGCTAPFVAQNPSWYIDDVCQTSSPINLNTLLSPSATLGGSWSGTAGVTDSIFNPSGILGSVSIAYTLAASGACATILDSTINFNVVLAPVNGVINQQSCDSINLGGVWYYNDTTLNNTIPGSFDYSCDSTYSIVIDITSEIIDSSYFESCMSYSHEGVLYTSDTILYDTISVGGSSGGVTCPELYFSEYAEGSSNNKYFEIYNGTGATVNLANYSVERYNNGATVASDVQVLSGMLADGDVFVIYNSGANAVISAAGDLPSTLTFYNGDDAIALFNGTSMIDLIGNIGCDPGTLWGTGALVTAEASLVRNANYTVGVTVDPGNTPCDFPSLNTTNWTGLAQDDFSNVGFHTSNCSGSITSGCDTIRVVEINILESVTSTQSITACDSAQVLGNWLFSSVSINDTIVNGSVMGCDSIVTYAVQINNSVTTNEINTSCDSSDVGTVVQNLLTSNNCDSTHIIVTSLILGDSTFATATSCNPTDTGFSTTSHTAINTCDSLHTIYTSLLLTDSTAETVTSCNPLDTGFSSTTFVTATCDSVHTVYTSLILGDSTFATILSCNPSDTGSVTQTFTAANTCDSLHTVYTSLILGDSIYVNETSCNPLDTGLSVITYMASNTCDSIHAIYISLSLVDSTFSLSSSCNAIDTGFSSTTFATSTCDSVHTVYTSLLAEDSTFATISSCNISDTGFVTQTFMTATCDSLHTVYTSLILGDSTFSIDSSCNAIDTGFSSTTFATSTCDSVHTVYTSLLAEDSTFATITSCNVSDTGFVTQTFTTSTCDSLHTVYTSLILGDSTFSIDSSCNAIDTGFATITYTAVNSCDSLHTIYTTLLSCGFCFDYDTSNICFADSVFLQGAWQNTSGLYYDTIVSPGLTICDTILETFLSVSSMPVSSLTNVCTNDVAQVAIITDTLTNALGCDSIYNVTNTFLTIVQSDTNEVCTNDVLLAGSVIDTLFSVGSCDSVYNVTNTVLITPIAESLTSCTNDFAMSGVQIDTVLSSGNCDSVYRTNTIEFIPTIYITANNVCTNNSALANIDTVLTTQSVAGCDSIFTITETVFQAVQSIPLSSVSVCEGVSVSIFGVNQNVAGIYQSTPILNSLGCDSAVETIELIVNPNPNVDAGLDESIIAGAEITLTASGADTYLWTTSESTQEITVSPNTTTTYILIGTDLNDCTAMDSVTINVSVPDDIIQIPTAFSPNNDGSNDIFRITNESLFENIEFRVYNRWGELIFVNTKSVSGWDGVYKNVKQPLGTYIYYIDAISISDKKKVSVSGSVTLLR